MTIPNLPAELVISITEYLPAADTKRMCETCSCLRDICTPELYRTIDLSIHNADIECKPFVASEIPVPPDFLEREPTEWDEKLFERQNLFIRAMNEGLDNGIDRASYVKKMVWTILDPTPSTWGYRTKIPASDSDEEDEEGEIYAPEDEPLWRIFRAMKNVASIDLCCLRFWREVTCPGPLFLSASSIRLGGCMTPNFAARILHPPYQRLHHLDLNNLIKWSDTNTESFEPLPCFDHLRDLAAYVRDSSDPVEAVDDTHQQIDILVDLVDYPCANLRSLHISTGGSDDWFSRNGRDHQLYASWARLIGSVRPSLAHLSFEQGINIGLDNAPRANCRVRPSHDHRCIDALFVTHILPVLVEHPWPSIKRMVIRGVGRKTHVQSSDNLPTEEEMAMPGASFSVMRSLGYSNYEITKTLVAFTYEDREKLRELLPHDAELVIEEEQSRDFEHVVNGDLGIPWLELDEEDEAMMSIDNGDRGLP